MRTHSVSAIQKQFWILNKLFPENAAYNIPMVYKINGIPDINILEKAINTIITRHESLRVDFKLNKRNIEQTIYDENSFTFKIEYVEVNKEFSDHEIEGIIEEIHKPFKLDEWPLFRIKLFVYKNNISVLSIVFHHIIVDQHSKNIFTRELSQLYNHYKCGCKHNLKEDVIQYAEYVNWEKKWLKTNEARKMLQYWHNNFANSDYFLHLPTDYKRPQYLSHQGKSRYFSLDKSITEKIVAFSKENTIRAFVVLLTAYAIMLHKLSYQNNITIGVPLTNRRKEKTKDIFGVFVNILPIVVNFSAQLTGIKLIRQIRHTLLQAHRNQEIPFLHIVDHVKFKRNPSYTPFFQVGFTFAPPLNINLEELEIFSLIIEREGVQLDLFYTLWEKDGTIHGYSEYPINLFEESTIKQWENLFRDIICRIIQNPDMAIESLDIVSD